MPGVSKEQIAKAKEWDLLSYLEAYEPTELKRCGPHEYCLRSHDSLKISNGKWHWYSRSIGGKTALDYLMKVQDIPFVQAVEMLCGAAFSYQPPKRQEPKAAPQKPFTLPAASMCPSSVVSYLQGRGIDSEIIQECLRRKILYQSKQYRNCVFVGRDPRGQPKFACLRGTQGSFRMDVAGSDKRYNFCLSAPEGCTDLAVAESAVDALSLATLAKLRGKNWRGSTYLSLSGTSPLAMIQYLRDHPQIRRVSLCLDNDEAGRLGIAKLENAIRQDPQLSKQVVDICCDPPPERYGKDYNDALCALRQRHERRHRADLKSAFHAR